MTESLLTAIKKALKGTFMTVLQTDWFERNKGDKKADTSKGWKEVLKDMKDEYPDRNLTAAKIQSKWKKLKDKEIDKEKRDERNEEIEEARNDVLAAELLRLHEQMMRTNKKYRSGTGNGPYKPIPDEIPADLTPTSHPANPACTSRKYGLVKTNAICGWSGEPLPKMPKKAPEQKRPQPKTIQQGYDSRRKELEEKHRTETQKLHDLYLGVNKHLQEEILYYYEKEAKLKNLTDIEPDEKEEKLAQIRSYLDKLEERQKENSDHQGEEEFLLKEKQESEIKELEEQIEFAKQHFRPEFLNENPSLASEEDSESDQETETTGQAIPASHQQQLNDETKDEDTISINDDNDDNQILIQQDGSGAQNVVEAVYLRQNSTSKNKSRNKGKKTRKGQSTSEVSFLEKARYEILQKEFEYRKKLDFAVVQKKIECEQRLFETKQRILETIQLKVEASNAQELIEDSGIFNSLNNLQQ